MYVTAAKRLSGTMQDLLWLLLGIIKVPRWGSTPGPHSASSSLGSKTHLNSLM